MRLAQRAYRKGKDSTIHTLSSRFAQLENCIDAMSRSFLGLNFDTIASDLLKSHPQLAQYLRAVEAHFLNLVERAASTPDKSSEFS
jgi:hypothetical protein